MTSDILKRAAEAVKGVTPGPWAVFDRWNVSSPKCEVMNGSIMVRDDAESDANARFIAAARTLIPDMAAAIAERDAEIERLRRGLNVAWADRDMHSAARAEAEEVAERLTARAEAAEMETMEQARLNGMGAERELALMAKAERWERLFAAATGMVSIVEGIDGAMNHGVWRDERGMRIKDTPEWVSLYNNHAAMKEGR